MRRSHTSERKQLDLFRALPGDLAARDAQDLMAYPFFSLAKSKRIVPIDFRAGKLDQTHDVSVTGQTTKSFLRKLNCRS